MCIAFADMRCKTSVVAVLESSILSLLTHMFCSHLEPIITYFCCCMCEVCLFSFVCVCLSLDIHCISDWVYACILLCQSSLQLHRWLSLDMYCVSDWVRTCSVWMMIEFAHALHWLSPEMHCIDNWVLYMHCIDILMKFCCFSADDW